MCNKLICIRAIKSLKRHLPTLHIPTESYSEKQQAAEYPVRLASEGASERNKRPFRDLVIREQNFHPHQNCNLTDLFIAYFDGIQQISMKTLMRIVNLRVHYRFTFLIE